ncbi:MAG: cardiolipin synthase [Alphaproteobacteria bacterium]
MFEYVQQYWPYAATSFVVMVTVVLSASVILYKRNERAAIAWVGLILLSPIIGSIAYLLLGINRIRRRASRIRPRVIGQTVSPPMAQTPSDPASGVRSGAVGIHQGLTRLTDALATNRLTPANSITPLVNGDAAYPDMIQAIEGARRSICFETYIFKYDVVGREFVAALERAVARGVEVRVLVDGVGQIYSWPPIARALQAAGIPHSRFMYSLWPWRMPYLNLRNHQKILVIDGKTGFTGGMNISAANRTDAQVRRIVRDIHFKVEGPLVAHLTEAFADDWYITTKESLVGESWFPPLTGKSDVVARGIPSGPHESVERMRWIFAAAISEARQSLRVMTPYFLPDETLAAGLRLAALRGVEVDIILPEKTNLAFVTWAAMARLDELIRVGCRVWLGPPPFNHSKLMLVDDCWALVGSSNWDPRSLILNFEFNVECQGTELVRQLGGIFAAELAQARRLTLDDLQNRNIFVKLRDGIARLFSPYL